jgi:hypothetical protein
MPTLSSTFLIAKGAVVLRDQLRSEPWLGRIHRRSVCSFANSFASSAVSPS